MRSRHDRIQSSSRRTQAESRKECLACKILTARQTLRSSAPYMASDVKCPTTTEMSRLEACPILSSSRSACQSFHCRRTLGLRRPVSEKDWPNSSKFPGSRDIVRLQPKRVGPVQHSVPNLSDVCCVGTNRSDHVDVDRQHREGGQVGVPAGCPPAQVTETRRRARPEKGRSGKMRVHASTPSAKP